MKDFHEILGVGARASADEIRRRYRFLAQAYHPDRFPDPKNKEQAEAEFKQVQEAYQALSDPRKRAAYERTRARPVSRPAASPRPGSSPPGHVESPPDDGRVRRGAGWPRQKVLGVSGAKWAIGTLFLLNLFVRDPLFWDDLALLVLWLTIDKLLMLFGR